MSKVVDLHKAGAPKELGIYIITCSTSRYNEPETSTKTDDISGDIIEQLVLNAGHRLEGRRLKIENTFKGSAGIKDSRFHHNNGWHGTLTL